MSSELGEMEVWCSGEEWCPVTSTATLLGRKWHPVILHRLLRNGPSGFNELKNAVDGVSSKVLSDSLENLEDRRLIDRTIVNEKPVRVEYSLTDTGASLEPLLDEMERWGNEHLDPASPEQQ